MKRTDSKGLTIEVESTKGNRGSIVDILRVNLILFLELTNSQFNMVTLTLITLLIFL